MASSSMTSASFAISRLSCDDFEGLRRVSATRLAPAARWSMRKLSMKAAEEMMMNRNSRKSSLSRVISCKSSSSSTLEEVSDIIATQLSVERPSVKPETKFSELGADSLDTVEIVMALEEKFGVTIGEQDAGNVSTVQQVVDLIEKQQAVAS